MAGRRKKHLRRARLWLDVSVVGIQFPVAIALGYFFGSWLDRQLGTDPWLMIVFALFGIVAGFVNLFRITAQASESERQMKEIEEAENASRGDEPDDP